MKKSLIILIGVFSIGAALPVVAGPDWQLIEQGRKAKSARMQQAAAQQTQTSGSSASGSSASGSGASGRIASGHPDPQKRMPGRSK